MTPANITNDLIGIRGKKALAQKATHVLKDVTAISFAARRHHGPRPSRLNGVKWAIMWHLLHHA